MASLPHGVVAVLFALVWSGIRHGLPRLNVFFRRYQEARESLAVWRHYEIHISPPDESFKREAETEEFHRFARSLSQLGFDLLGEYVLTGGSQFPVATSPRKTEFLPTHFSLQRVLEHKRIGCVTLLSASLRHEGPDISLQIVSSNGDWTYASEVGDPSGRDRGHSERTLKSFHGSLSAEQLLDDHLRRRDEIARAGNFAWGAPMTLEQIHENEETFAAYLRAFSRQHSPRSFMKWERQSKPHTAREWLGELEGHL